MCWLIQLIDGNFGICLLVSKAKVNSGDKSCIVLQCIRTLKFLDSVLLSSFTNFYQKCIFIPGFYSKSRSIVLHFFPLQNHSPEFGCMTDSLFFICDMNKCKRRFLSYHWHCLILNAFCSRAIISSFFFYCSFLYCSIVQWFMKSSKINLHIILMCIFSCPMNDELSAKWRMLCRKIELEFTPTPANKITLFCVLLL